MMLNLGCGWRNKPHFVNVDLNPIYKPDVLHDLTKPWPWKDRSVRRIEAEDFVEHLGWDEQQDHLIFVMNEAWRVLGSESDCWALIRTPLAGTSEAYRDPTHRRFFVPESFHYFSAYNDEWKMHGQYYGIKPWKIMRLSINEGRVIEVKMSPVVEG